MLRSYDRIIDHDDDDDDDDGDDDEEDDDEDETQSPVYSRFIGYGSANRLTCDRVRNDEQQKNKRNSYAHSAGRRHS